jgi:hypothetical protein
MHERREQEARVSQRQESSRVVATRSRAAERRLPRTTTSACQPRLGCLSWHDLMLSGYLFILFILCTSSSAIARNSPRKAAPLQGWALWSTTPSLSDALVNSGRSLGTDLICHVGDRRVTSLDNALTYSHAAPQGSPTFSSNSHSHS